MKEPFTRFNAAKYLKTSEDGVAYLNACLDDDSGDGRLIREALVDIARASDIELKNEIQPTLTRHIRHTLAERIQQDPAFIEALMKEADSLCALMANSKWHNVYST